MYINNYMLEIELALISAFIGSVALLLQKSGFKKARYMFLSTRWILGTFLMVLSFFIYVISISVGQLIIVQILFNSSVLFLVILEIILFKLKIKSYEAMSIALFLLGVILMQVSL